MMHFISRKYKICHSERSEESAEARTPYPKGVIGADAAGRYGVAGPAAPDPNPVRGATDSSLRSE